MLLESWGGRDIENINTIATAFAQDDYKIVEVYAASALASLQIAPEAISQVIKTLHKTSDCLLIATEELIKLGRANEACPILRRVLNSWHEYPPEMVIEAMRQACQLGPSYTEEVASILRRLLSGGSYRIKIGAIYYLARLQVVDSQTVSLLRDMLNSRELSEGALEALFMSGNATVDDVAVLEKMTRRDKNHFWKILRDVPRSALSNDVVRAIEKLYDSYPALTTPLNQSVLFGLGIIRKSDIAILLQQYWSPCENWKNSVLTALEKLWFALGCQSV